MKTLRISFFAGAILLLTMCSSIRKQHKELSNLDRRANEIKMYAEKKGYSTRYCFLLDMSLPSGLKRFFVYDMTNDTVVFSGLVAHGCCDEEFLKEARFSNEMGSGCTSIGVYKVGYAYNGQYGKAYKLYGLQNTNSNAYDRAIVIHGNPFIPDVESYPKPICNSNGCTMVSFAFLNKLSCIIDKENKSILLWVYEKHTSQKLSFS